MRIKLNKILLIFFTCLIALLSSCTCINNWQEAKIIHKNAHKEHGLVCIRKYSFFEYIQFKPNESSKPERLYPENIQLVKIDNTPELLSLSFSKDDYGVDSYSFGKILSGNTVKLVNTKHLYNTCNCDGKDSYREAYFLISNDEKFKIQVNRRGKILNYPALKQFVLDKTGTKIQNPNCISDLAQLIKNINK